MQTYQISV